jgi:hypothetical protein
MTAHAHAPMPSRLQRAHAELAATTTPKSWRREPPLEAVARSAQRNRTALDR